MSKIDSVFAEKFPGYSVQVIPGCISNYREEEYIYRAKAAAIGYMVEENVSIDKENKVVTFHR